ncbi:MAG: hypothetical protein COS82_07020 [Zetaproteobacteria bacterium CG06_land_8_20_14_3_00_59_53]|nr:MAG: hypothetical protein AUK36_03945 [Zetaproteobacteria bacterium CG2_30_59_37]PIO89862.1 MAG: hypothetical protein COX56_05645 [Zetaproteobacteria bacterium CG23_combo_of_CG06-09_8_20_14_all_59_86]PIQ64226.1 MAG: hypothetical protein COV97_09900 [Zetaproteobacteria bacterium CG11_big_fil_rev_8_21_14_0_20_59_439]PIU70428.1 MAG: hypothetical protein COS82_07020 [Zetaproteobacteria bacterium CG06_land_8_20_14_3_00_59_53]PIU97449.1 MAG: hypothetical protein COS62_03525 [Zetaproteobacteria bac
MNSRPDLLRLMQIYFACPMAFVAILLGFAAGLDAHEVDIVFSDRHRPHVETVRVLQQALRAEDVRLFEVLENGDTGEEIRALNTVVRRKPDLIVLVGDDALRAALSMKVRIPMVSLLAVRLHRGFAADIPLTGVDLRPDPHEVTVELLRLVPGGASVLTYFSPDLSGSYIREAEQAFRECSMTLSARVWPDHDVVTALNREIAAYDIYWMQLEERSARPDMLRLLFSVAARHDKGLIGLSEKYVRTGAMIAWTPMPENVGFQGGVLANRVLAGESPQAMPVEHPTQMKVSINHDVHLQGRHDESLNGEATLSVMVDGS